MENQQIYKLPHQSETKRESLGEGTLDKWNTTTGKEMWEGGKTIQAEKSFTRDAGKLWNQAAKEMNAALTIGIAKEIIKQYCKQLPI